MSYTLDSANDSFQFDIRGKKYVMRYPITSELEAIQDKTTELQAASQAEVKDLEKIKDLSDKLEDALYEFITPDGHDLPIKEALSTENVRVMRNFNAMIRTELAV